MVLFLRNIRFNFMLFWGDYYLRWWRLPIEERACRETDLGGGDYYLRNSGLPPSSQLQRSVPSLYKPWRTVLQPILALCPHCSLLRLRGSNLTFGKLHIWEVATQEIDTCNLISRPQENAFGKVYIFFNEFGS